MSEIEGHSIKGSPKPAEEAAILRAIDAALLEEKLAGRPSAWKLTGRAIALRLGGVELRHRLPGRWSISDEIGWQGTRPADLRGRGDAK